MLLFSSDSFWSHVLENHWLFFCEQRKNLSSDPEQSACADKWRNCLLQIFRAAASYSRLVMVSIVYETEETESPSHWLISTVWIFSLNTFTVETDKNDEVTFEMTLSNVSRVVVRESVWFCLASFLFFEPSSFCFASHLPSGSSGLSRSCSVVQLLGSEQPQTQSVSEWASWSTVQRSAAEEADVPLGRRWRPKTEIKLQHESNCEQLQPLRGLWQCQTLDLQTSTWIHAINTQQVSFHSSSNGVMVTEWTWIENQYQRVEIF